MKVSLQSACNYKFLIMYNVPHKFRQVCRLCLTLVSECDVAELQIYNNSSHKSAQSQAEQHHKVAEFRKSERPASCFCRALSPNVCSCVGDNSLSVVLTNNETGPSQSLHKSHYTPSVPSTVDAISSGSEPYAKSFSSKSQLETVIAERSVFKSQSTSSQLHETPASNAGEESESETNAELPREEQSVINQTKIIHSQNQSQSQPFGGTDNCGQEHGRDDSSSHLTFQIFNCLSIKVSRFPSNTFAQKRIYINYAHIQRRAYGGVCVCVIYVITTPHVKIIGNDWAAFIPWPINNRYQLLVFFFFPMNHFEAFSHTHTHLLSHTHLVHQYPACECKY